MNEKYIRLIACAGSGKTEVVKGSYIACVDTNETKNKIKKEDTMKSIAMFTFTNAAASEMKDRVVGEYLRRGENIDKSNLHIMTFDAYHLRNICNHYEIFGYTAPPKPVDETTEKSIIFALIDNPVIPGLDYKNLKTIALPTASMVFDTINSLGIDPRSKDGFDAICEACANADSNLLRKIDLVALRKLCDLYADYEALLVEKNQIPFGFMAKYGLQLLEDYPEVLDDYSYKYIIVDESQDSDVKQLETLKKLISTSYFKRLMVVGDDNQAIYSFRKTDPKILINLFDLLKVPPEECKTFYLTDNRRSTPEILKLADNFVAKNVNKLQKTSNPFREHGIEPIIRGFYNDDDELNYIIENIKKVHNEENVPWKNIAIIFRTGKESLKFSARLSLENIPWVSKSPLKLLSNSRVLAAIELAKAFETPDNNTHYKKYMTALMDGVIDEENIDMIKEEMDRMKNIFSNICFKEFEEQRNIFHEYLDALRRDTDEIYEYFLDIVYNNEDLPSEIEFINNMIDYSPNIRKKMEANYMGVVLTTAHSSKGLEWPVVFCTISEFDSKRLHRGHKSDDEIEETRRLIYVAMTRARDRLFITSRYTAYGSKEDRTYNQFLKELYDQTGMDFQPIDPMEAVKEAERKAKYIEKAKERKMQKALEMQKTLNDLGLGLTKRNPYTGAPKKTKTLKSLPSGHRTSAT